MRAPLLPLIAACLGVALPCYAQPRARSDAATAAPAQSGGADLVDATPIAQGFVGDAWADDKSPMTFGFWSFRVLLQTRYEHSYPAASDNPRSGYALREALLARDGDGLSLQRFFFRMTAAPSPYVAWKSILDFSKLRGSDVSNVLKQAHMVLRPVPKRVELVAGIFKLPYSILELDPVARFELPNLGQADDLVKNLGYAGRDVGVELMLAPLPRPRWLRIQLGIFQGHAHDEHASPIGAVGGRVESKPIKGLRLGFDVVAMPRAFSYKRPFETSDKELLPNPADPAYPREQRWGRAVAYSVDASFTRKRFSLRMEGMLGDRVDVDARYGARSFWSVWALVSQRFKLGPLGLMPAARAEWLDGDREHSLGGRLELSGALNLLYKKRVRCVLAVTRKQVQAHSPALEQPRPLPYTPYFELDSTRLTLQLQLEI